MYNDYYLLKRIEDEEGELSFATAMDSFIYKGEVIEKPFEWKDTTSDGTVYPKYPEIGDKIQFLKGSGEDMGDGLKAVKFEDIIRKI